MLSKAILLCLLVSVFVVVIVNGENTESSQTEVNVNFYIWSTPNPSTRDCDSKSKLVLSVPASTTLFSAMESLSKLSKAFQFEYKEFSFGRYITAINGKVENPTKNLHWMIYKLPIQPNTKHPPPAEYLTSVGVDDLKVQHNDNYLFWFRHIESWTMQH